MSQFSLTKKPEWNNDGLLPNHVSTNVYPSPRGWVAPKPGVPKTTITGMTWSGGVVTVTAPNHGLVAGPKTKSLIIGVVPTAYNGYYPTVTYVDVNTFSYPLTSNPGVVTTQGKACQSEVIVAIGGLDVLYADLIVLPTFTAVASYSGAAHMVTGDILTVTLTASEAVAFQNITATSYPYVNVVIGTNTRPVYYSTSLSTPTSLVFKYTVIAGDVATLGNVVGSGTLNLNGSVIQDVAGTAGTHNTAFTPGAFTAPVTSTIYVN